MKGSSLHVAPLLRLVPPRLVEPVGVGAVCSTAFVCSVSHAAFPFAGSWFCKSLVFVLIQLSQWGGVILILHLPSNRRLQLSLRKQLWVAFGSIGLPLFMFAFRLSIWFKWGTVLWQSWTALSTIST